jgi:hypothetical protein
MFMLTGGFFRLPDDIPKPVWTYPVSLMAFHSYANEVVLQCYMMKQSNLFKWDETLKVFF